MHGDPTFNLMQLLTIQQVVNCRTGSVFTELLMRSEILQTGITSRQNATIHIVKCFN